MTIHQVLLAALIAWLALWAEHWFPWRLFLRRDLPRIPAYVLGVLALTAPLTALLWSWQSWAELAAMWVVVIAGGAAVISAYGVDWLGRWVSGLVERVERLEMSHDRTDQR